MCSGTENSNSNLLVSVTFHKICFGNADRRKQVQFTTSNLFMVFRPGCQKHCYHILYSVYDSSFSSFICLSLSENQLNKTPWMLMKHVPVTKIHMYSILLISVTFHNSALVAPNRGNESSLRLQTCLVFDQRNYFLIKLLMKCGTILNRI